MKIRSITLERSGTQSTFFSNRNSNNYNMKSSHYKCQQVLQILVDISILREDSCLFSKIALFEPDKKLRNQYYLELSRHEQQRMKIESKLEPILNDIEINEFWKTYLFQFGNKIYKNIKNFHQKLNTFSNKIAEITDTNSFLQLLRNSCIQKLTESKQLKIFISQITEKLRERFQKDIFILNNFGINNKTIELAKKEENSKNHRFLTLLREKDSHLFFLCHNRALARLDLQAKKILSKQFKPRPINPYSQLLEIEEESPLATCYIMQNGMIVNLAYKDEGFCEFITTKYNRMTKDLLSKNSFNERSINRFRERYNQFFNKTKRIVKSNTFYEDSQHKSHKRAEKAREMQLSSSIEMKNITNLIDKDGITIEPESMCDIPKKNNIFKIQRLESRKKSHTLRPLGQSKENNKEVVHQKIIQMKLEEEPLQIAKILRIRKRKYFPNFKEENGWSLIVKENRSKISFLIQ